MERNNQTNYGRQSKRIEKKKEKRKEKGSLRKPNTLS